MNPLKVLSINFNLDFLIPMLEHAVSNEMMKNIKIDFFNFCGLRNCYFVLVPVFFGKLKNIAEYIFISSG